jgi:predicted lipoprotein
MKKIVIIIIIGLFGYNSVYFKKLSELNNNAIQKFDFTKYTDSLYHQGILKNDTIINLNALLSELSTNKEAAFNKYGNKLSIGNSAHFMVKISGEIAAKTNEGFTLKTDNGQNYSIDSKFIFGNAIRDASKLVKLTDFKTNTEFNQISESLNKLVREDVLPKKLKDINVGDKIIGKGVISQSKKENLPIKITLVDIEKP